MRDFVGLVLVLALVASPLWVSAQAGEEIAPKAALSVHTQHRLPPQLMLRSSYFLYVDTDEISGAASGQTESDVAEPTGAHEDGEVASSESNLEESVSSPAPGTAVPDIDTLSQRAIEDHEIRYEIPSGQEKHPKRRRRLKIALGITVPIVVVGSAILIGAAVALSQSEF